MSIYTSLFKQNVRVTQSYKGTDHRGLDLSTGKVEQPVYLPKRAVQGYVWKILAGYYYKGKYYSNAPIIYIKHKDGSGSRYIHSYPKNVKVKVGDTIKAGVQVCATGNSGYSFGDHLHFEWLKKWDDLSSHTDPIPYLTSENTNMFTIGDNIKFTEVQNIRKGSGTSYPVLSQSSIGQTGVIFDGPREADGYTWWDIHFSNKSSGWVADVGKFIKYTPAPVKPPEAPELIECQSEVKRLKEQLSARETQLRASQAHAKQLEEDLAAANDRISKIEADKELADEEYKELLESHDSILKEKERFEAQYMECVTELNLLKEGRDNWLNRLADALHKLFSSK